MAKPKASTLQARFGFLDDDLKTSDHDEIMTWLDSNSKTLLEKITQWQPVWEKEKVALFQCNAQSAVINQVKEWQTPNSLMSKPNGIDIGKFESWKGLGEPPVKPPLEIETTWEYTVSGANKFIVGFIDMKVVVYDSDLNIENIQYQGYCKGYMLTHHLHSEQKYSIPSWWIERKAQKRVCYFEVKSTLPSLGELIRQIRMYQEFLNGSFYVVAPDDKYAQQLQKQGIGFVKYPEGQISS